MNLNNRRDRLAATLALALIFFLSVPHFSLAFEKEINDLSLTMSESISNADKKMIAVVDFTDLQGNVTELGRFLAEEFSVALAGADKGFEVVDRTHLKSIIAEHKLSATGIIDPQTARKLGKIAGVEALITGTITPFGDSVRLSVKILDTATAKVIGASRGNIAKTQAIEELLSRGIESGRNISQQPTSSQKLNRGYVPRYDSKCTYQNLCLKDQSFEVKVIKLSKKGKSVNISLSVRNITKEDIKVSIYGKYAIMTNSEGEEKYKSSNRYHMMVKSGAIKNLGYNFKFKGNNQGKLFDFILAFESPSASYSFIDIASN